MDKQRSRSPSSVTQGSRARSRSPDDECFFDLFDNVAVAAALKASRTVSVGGNLTFPSSIANSKVCTFLGFPAIWGRWWLAEAL
ncbi:hypothetical protein TIFTF001_033141 [Ficus carica]|uniref:Uncharacterized protein n=1 Tax=Ficus carica TaxID=3494 RepID=A0AA88J6R8_FICCA|nr:hypothetical protein TIFTF001_033141 [Ficus carica]